MLAHRFVCLWLASLGAWGLACSEAGTPGGAGEARPGSGRRANVLLITIDSLRADHLGSAGYARATSPGIDRFMAEAVTFDDAHSTSSWTLPALGSLFSSQYPSTLGMWQLEDPLAPSFETLAERLAAEGYRTAAVTSHVLLGSKFGLGQGFERYDQQLIRSADLPTHEVRTSPEVARKGMSFIDARARERFEEARPWLLWLHFFDPHTRYLEHRGITSKFGEEEVDLYDGEIAYTDRYVTRVIRKLGLQGLDDHTIVVLAADHGEAFGAHGGSGHGHTLHAEVVRIPLAIRVPGFEPRRVAGPVSLVDVLPTLLELLGIEAGAAPLTGRSLVAAMRGEAPGGGGRLLESRFAEAGPRALAAWVEADWKLVVETSAGAPEASPPRRLLFDRRADPGESRDVAGDHPAVLARMDEALGVARREAEDRGEAFEPAAPLVLTPGESEALRALGYLGGDAGPDEGEPTVHRANDATGASPGGDHAAGAGTL